MYSHKDIEKKWSTYWKENNLFYTDVWDFSKPKYYVLDMFPYPSGAGLHVGHVEGYTATDIVSRFKRKQGFNVLHPMGWDAFGLPAEQYAIDTGNHPEVFTKNNIEVFKKQLDRCGLDYDWSKELATSDPKFYKWTQWIFKNLYEDGLAKHKDMPVNWCEELGTVLANDEVINGVSERGGFPVVRKNMKQWAIDIPKYAETLLSGLDKIDWPNSTKEIQRNWIGKSVGAHVNFTVADTSFTFTVFTTRPDTLFGATYCVLSPEHELVNKITKKEYLEDITKYQRECSSKSDLERTELNKDKTGVFTGAYAVNPVNNKKIPIYIADYVLASYGTGAIMAVPAHDQRDYEFAQIYDIEMIQVIKKVTGEKRENEAHKNSIVAVVYDSKENKYLTINWGKFGGRLFIGGTKRENESSVNCAIREIKEETGYTNIKHINTSMSLNHHYYAHNKQKAYNIDCYLLYFELLGYEQEETNLDKDEENYFKVEWVDEKTVLNEVNDELHKAAFDYKLNKAYEGDGIHINSEFLDGLDKESSIDLMIKWLEENNCGKKTINYRLRDWIFARQRYWGEPVPIVHYENKSVALDTKDLPLELPKLDDYKGKNGMSPLESADEWKNFNGGLLETSTMPGSAGSSWYFLRYLDPNNTEKIADERLLKHWLPVDLYVGGPEHAVGHLLYSRMWNNYLYDKGIVPVSEPFKKLVHQGMILGANGIKMGKRYKEFVINPIDIIDEFGADTLRLYEMFMGPIEADKPWNDSGVDGARKFLERVYRLYTEEANFVSENKNLEKIYHQTVKKVTDDFEQLNFNTAISQMMIFINAVYKEKDFPLSYAKGFINLLNPICPFLTEEIWSEVLEEETSLVNYPFPKFDIDATIEDTFELVVQVNGKVRGKITVDMNTTKEEMEKMALEIENVKNYTDGSTISKIIVVPKKLVSIVVK